MEKNTVTAAKKTKDPKKIKKPKKAFEEKKSVRKLKKQYTKTLKKISPERTISVIAIVLMFVTAVLDAIIEGKEEK